jgi:glycine/D-amino acid oxidase-like deaminating enzyme
VTVIGDGVIGLAIAWGLARRNVRCRVLGARRAGIASTAAAGILAPSVAHLPAEVKPFFYGSLNRFPDFIDGLRHVDASLAIIEGLVEISADPAESEPNASGSPDSLDGPALGILEPALGHLDGARFYPREGAIDNVRLVAALGSAISKTGRIDLVRDEPVAEIDCSVRPAIVWAESGAVYASESVVLGAGAWTPLVRGPSRRVPVSPLKGQMLALQASPLRHTVMAPDVYLVPRGSETLVGATSEDAGFDASPTRAEIDELRAAAVSLCPTLRDAPTTRMWAGIRPVTPDMLPILGPDPEFPSLLYACGHSRNGILLAPATAEVIASRITGAASPLDAAPFRVERFDRSDWLPNHPT